MRIIMLSDIFLNYLERIDFRKTFKYTCEEMHNEAVSTWCDYCVGIAPLDGLHHFVSSPARTSPAISSNADIANTITD